MTNNRARHLDASAMIGFYRNDEAIVADRHELVLNRLGRPAHQSFERTRDTRAQHIDLMTNSSQFRTGAIVELAIWKNLVCDARNECIQLTWQILDQLPKHGSILALCENGGSRLTSPDRRASRFAESKVDPDSRLRRAADRSFQTDPSIR